MTDPHTLPLIINSMLIAFIMVVPLSLALGWESLCKTAKLLREKLQARQQ